MSDALSRAKKLSPEEIAELLEAQDKRKESAKAASLRKREKMAAEKKKIISIVVNEADAADMKKLLQALAAQGVQHVTATIHAANKFNQTSQNRPTPSVGQSS